MSLAALLRFLTQFVKTTTIARKNNFHSLIQTVGSETRTRAICRKRAEPANCIRVLCERAHSTLKKLSNIRDRPVKPILKAAGELRVVFTDALSKINIFAIYDTFRFAFSFLSILHCFLPCCLEFFLCSEEERLVLTYLCCFIRNVFFNTLQFMVGIPVSEGYLL